MTGRTAAVSACVLALALAGCGSTKKESTASTATSSVPPGGVAPPVSTTYNVTLASFSEGAPNGSGFAVITINAPNQLCWKFSALKNFKPTEARIFRAVIRGTGNGGIRLGHKYKPTGCADFHPRTLGLLESLAAKPQKIFVSIHGVHYPNGAVRGALGPP
jgi:hypothetical protein